MTVLVRDTKRVSDLAGDLVTLIRSEENQVVAAAALSLTLLEFVKTQPDPDHATKAMRVVFEHLLDHYDEPGAKPVFRH